MAEDFNLDKAKEIIEGGIAQAQELINDPAKVDELIAQIQQQLQNLPDTFKTAAANVPLMIDMVKAYMTQEYTEVSPKVVASLVATFLYLLKGKDLIPDNVPVLGIADDLAVATFAMTLCEPELKAFDTWRSANQLPQA
jgi:uncharacterized membrane protein YkvA (DUF1232 family)